MLISYNGLHLPLLFSLVAILLSLSSTAIIGTFGSLQKKELTGDVLAHASLPGIALAFILTGTKATIPITIGAFISSTVAFFLIELLSSTPKVNTDTALSFTLAFFSGLGLVGLSYIQTHIEGEAGGLEYILFGNVASLTQETLKLFIVFASVLLVALLLCFKQWELLSFDYAFAHGIGLPVRRLQNFFYSITVFSIVLGIHAVGIILMSALLITPAVAARCWASRLVPILFIATLFACLAGTVGFFLSLYSTNLRTGPCMVICITAIACFSFLCAPQKGFLAGKLTQYRHRKKISRENILKLFCELAEEDNAPKKPRHFKTLVARHSVSKHISKASLKELTAGGLLRKCGNNLWQLTEAGFKKGKIILGRHVLWESYLHKILKINPEEVHDDAESIEHLMPAEIERRIRKFLQKKERNG